MKTQLLNYKLLVLFMLMGCGNLFAQTQLAAWTFDSTPAMPNTPNSLAANLGAQAGTATIYANGTNGSSNWITASAGNELTTFGGATTNDPRVTPVAGNAYSPVGGTSLSANGKSMVIKYSMTGYENPILTFATRGSGTGFATHQWAWSTDNVSYTNFGTNTANTGSTFTLRTLDMSAIDNLDQATTVYLRITFSGATNATGNNRLDNIVITASEVNAPDVTTTAATSTSTESATLNGTVNANGLEVQASFEYGTTTAYGTSVEATPATVTGTAAANISADISGLALNQLYHFRALADDNGTITTGSDATFVTLAATPGSPIVSNPQPFTLDVTLDAGAQNGNPAHTEYAIMLGINYVQADGSIGENPFWQTASAWGTITVTGLESNTGYTFTVKARNSANVETANGEGGSGTTLVNTVATLIVDQAAEPFGDHCVNTTAVGSFTISAENLDGTDLSIATGTNYAFSLSQDGPFVNPLTVSYPGSGFDQLEVFVQFAPTAGQFYGQSAIISGGGLPNTVMTPLAGNGTVTFISASTAAASNIGTTTATLNGNLVEGCYGIFTYGFEYSTTNNFELGSGTVVFASNFAGSGFSVDLSSLEANTTYYFRAFGVDNLPSSQVGAQMSFTTQALPAPVANDATAILSNGFTANWEAVTGATGYRLDVSTTPEFGGFTPATDLIISEYVEGGGNNKYIEIYNGTGSAVDLSDYQLRLYANDSPTATATFNMAGTLANGQAIVYKNSSATIYGGATVTSSVANFNGDDAFAIYKESTDSFVDIFGQIGGVTGTAWTSGSITTLDRTLRRKPSVLSGVTEITTGFPTLGTEWDVFPIDNVANLGVHSLDNTFGIFVDGFENLSVSGTSQAVTGLTENTPYYYRVRAESMNSTSPNSNVITVTTAAAPPTFGAISQAFGVVCENSPATFYVTGLASNSTSTITYNIAGGDDQTVTNVIANASGFASFEVVLTLVQNGQVLTVTQVERTDAAAGSISVNSNNTVTLAVSANQTYYADADGDGYGNAASTILACDGAPFGYVSNADDCNDGDASVNGLYTFYTDFDGDGYGTGELVEVCASSAETAPFGYSSNNTDCNDFDPMIFQAGELYIDADGDGYNAGPAGMICYGNTVPSGYTATDIGTDCDDSLVGINPGAIEIFYNGFDDNCNGILDEGNQILSQITSAQCGTTLTTISSLISATTFNNSTGYRFEVTNTSTGVVQVIDRPLQWFSLTMLATYDYATTYSIRVMVQRNGVWLGYYGPACQVSSPAILDAGGAAQISASQCGITLATINTLIATNSIPNTTGYRFRVTNLTDPSAPNQVQTIDRTLHWFALTMLPTYTYGTTYLIEVAVKTNGDYSGYGSPCTISTPAVPTLTSCGQTIAASGTLISTISRNNTTSYRFELTNLNTNIVTTIDRPNHWFSFNMVPGYAPNTQYGVRVALMTSGVYSLFGDACVITSPGAAREGEVKETIEPFKAVAYPNPFAEGFGIHMTNPAEALVSVKVYDMTGRMLSEDTVTGTALESLKLGAAYPAGVYNVVVSQGENVSTLRVVKR